MMSPRGTLTSSSVMRTDCPTRRGSGERRSAVMASVPTRASALFRIQPNVDMGAERRTDGGEKPDRLVSKERPGPVAVEEWLERAVLGDVEVPAQGFLPRIDHYAAYLSHERNVRFGPGV